MRFHVSACGCVCECAQVGVGEVGREREREREGLVPASLSPQLACLLLLGSLAEIKLEKIEKVFSAQVEKRRKKMFQKIFFLSIPILEMFSIWKFAFALQRDKNRLKLFCHWEEKIFKINLYLLNDIWRKTTRLMFLRILSLLMQRDKASKIRFC